jgi:AraC-like DNA-binding protein
LLRTPDFLPDALPHDRSPAADVFPVLLLQLVQLPALGPDAGDTLCRGLGLEPGALELPDFRISPVQATRAVRRVLRLMDAPDLGVVLGSSFNVVSWGACLVGLMACATVRELLELAVGYNPLTTNLLDLGLQVADEECAITAEPWLAEADVHAFLVQHAFAALARIGRFVVAPGYGPKRVELRASTPLPLTTTLAAFGCAVHVGCAADRIVFGSIDLPIATADPIVARMYRRLLSQQRAGLGLQSELEAAILQTARSQLAAPPSASAFAASMNMSERTLRRRLHEIDLSYASLIDRERMRLALVLLQDRSQRYDSVARAVGLSDARALRRAVQRWTGHTPSQIRNNLV